MVAFVVVIANIKLMVCDGSSYVIPIPRMDHQTQKVIHPEQPF